MFIIFPMKYWGQGARVERGVVVMISYDAQAEGFLF